MTKLEMLQQALDELGDVSATELADHIHRRHGVNVDPRMVPILRASLQEKALLEQFRLQSQALAAVSDE